jgi:hypothetical protein
MRSVAVAAPSLTARASRRPCQDFRRSAGPTPRPWSRAFATPRQHKVVQRTAASAERGCRNRVRGCKPAAPSESHAIARIAGYGMPMHNHTNMPHRLRFATCESDHAPPNSPDVSNGTTLQSVECAELFADRPRRRRLASHSEVRQRPRATELVRLSSAHLGRDATRSR